MWHRHSMALALCVALAGCSGTIEEPGSGELGPGSAAFGGADGVGGPGDGDGDGDGAGDGSRDPEEAGYDPEDAAGLSDRPGPATRVARLTHAQWKNTVRDLLYIEEDTNFESVLRADPQQSGFIFEDDTQTLLVDEALWSGYQRAATDVALYVTSDPTRLAKIVPADSGDPVARRDELVDTLGLRAHRRPLTPEQQADYQALFDRGATLYSGLDPFDAGVRLFVEALLQSPHFLYRVELSTEVEGEVIPLDSYEIASRLSYLLWNTMPDATLFAAAAADELRLAQQAGDHAARMLEDPRAMEVVTDFHRQLLEIESYGELNPSPAFFPDAPATLGDSAIMEAELFVADVFASAGNYNTILTSTSTFVNEDLAAIYGLAGSFGPDFVAANLDPTQRKGIFTQVGFLAANASSADPDPIHRGVFLAERIACIHIAAPDVMTPPLPPAEGRTNREVTEDATEDPTTICAGCHSTLINPFGFPFEGYDAVGAFRTTDNGFPVDTSASPILSGNPTPVADAVELADALAADTGVHECYAKHWVEFAYGRAEVEEDEALVTRLAERSLDDTDSLKDLIVGLVKTESFMTRSIQELP